MVAGKCKVAGRRRGAAVWFLLFGWLLVALGAYGTWLAGCAAALNLSGPDLAEFVKFLPSVQSGSLPVQRHLFYLPAVALAVGVGLQVASPRLKLRPTSRFLFWGVALLVSLQMLPPAWSPSSLGTSEFRSQVVVLGACVLVLLCAQLLGRLPFWASGPLAALTSLLSGVLPLAQLHLIMPDVDALYGAAPALGWGFWATEVGLILAAGASLVEAVRAAVHRDN